MDTNVYIIHSLLACGLINVLVLLFDRINTVYGLNKYRGYFALELLNNVILLYENTLSEIS